jgi:glucose/arabinose dehydrogenase
MSMMRWSAVIVVGALLFSTLGAAPSPAATPIRAVEVATGLAGPLFVTHAPGDTSRLFILERSGRIKILRSGTVLTRPFLNVSSLITSSSGEQGLLGMAFDPHYATNGYFFLNFTNTLGNTVITRFQVSADPDSAVFTSRHDYLTINQPYSNHNGGMLAFGPNDGFLYVGMGDGGSGGDPENRAQNPDSLLGKILRLDVSGDTLIMPPSNPFFNSTGNRPAIWALGVRNPWRWSFDRGTGDLYIADVGQSTYEEINFQPAGSGGGQNYGWRRKEGLVCYDPAVNCAVGLTLTDPIYQYAHISSRCSITGGYVYRGCAIPDLQGTYFFADFCTGEIWSFRYDGSGILNFQSRNTELGITGGGISSFGEDAQGELYIVNLNAGKIYKIVPNGVPSQCNTGCCTGVTGNVDADAADIVDISDLAAMVDYLFFGGSINPCGQEANVDASPTGEIDISDLNQLIDFLFLSGALPFCP